MNSYDLVEYPSYAIPQTCPDKLAVVAAMFGMTPAHPGRARVLDVGCGSGGNLLPMALLWPEAEYIGVDLAETAIAKATARAKQLGLKNVRFECADLAALPAEFGNFDYIIAHGFISWVPKPVRKRLFEICRERLTPQGLAYISFNAYPGCHVRDMFREIMRFHTRDIHEPAQRADEARSIVHAIAESGVNADALQELARSERDIIWGKSTGALLHDELETNFNSLSFHEFAAMAEEHGLQFVGEAVYNEGQPPLNLTPDATALLERAKEGGLIVFEQYCDFLKLRRFRQSLVTHAGIALDRTAPPHAMSQFHFAAHLEKTTVPQGVEFTNPATKAGAVTANPVTVLALDRIAQAWPSTVPFDELADGPAQKEALGPVLERFFAAGLIDAHATPRRCASYPGLTPEIWSYARLQAESERVVTPLTLNGVALEDPNVRKLVLLADGTRTLDELATQFGDREGVERALASAARMGFLVR